MQNVKKEKVNNITDILEEIVRCVTAPSFCVMPWKCVTMAVGDRTDPLVKKSVVHIYRTCMDGQNIFQIKVHNCKKEVCDHAICTKDCETTSQINTKGGKDGMQNEINKKKRKKRNKHFDANKETTVGSCILKKSNSEELEKINRLKEPGNSKHHNSSPSKPKRIPKKSENKEKPSCTLQIFADGKSRKLNFQLHPAMKVFLGKALDRIEGHDTKGPNTSPTHIRSVPCEALLKRKNVGKSKMVKSPKQSSPRGNNSIRTESVEEFEINLPDNTGNGKDYRENLSLISGRSCHCDEEDDEFISKQKINVGYLVNNIIPVQQSCNGNGKPEKETHEVRTELQLGQKPEKCQNEQLTTNNAHQSSTIKPVPEPYHEREMGRLHHNEERIMRDEEIFHAPGLYNPTLQDHQRDHCASTYNNDGAKDMVKQIPIDSPRNVYCGNENNHQSYTKSTQCFLNRTSDNVIRTPFIVDHHTDNNEFLMNDIRNINDRNYSISNNRAAMHSTDYIHSPPVYRSNTEIYSPPFIPEAFSMPPQCGNFLTNNGVYSNRFYGNRQYHNFSNHETDFMNMRAPIQHNKNYNRHDIQFPNHIDPETHISHDERRIFNRYHLPNNGDINVYPEPEQNVFFRRTNKHEHCKHLEDVPTSDRNQNIIKDRVRNRDYCEESIDNSSEEACTYNCKKYIHTGNAGVIPEITKNHRSNKTIKRKDYKESENSNSNSNNRKSGSTTAGQYYNTASHSTAVDSNVSSNKEGIAKISDIENSSNSVGRNGHRRFNRGDKNNCNSDKKYSPQNSNEILQNTDPIHTDPNDKLINKSRIQYENEEEHSSERQENFLTFKHIKPSQIASEEKITDRQKINNRKSSTKNSNMSKTNAVDHSKSSKENRTNKKRTQSTNSMDSSNNFAQDVYIKDDSGKSSDISSFYYRFPEDYSNYHFFKPHRNINSRNQISRKIINDTDERLCDEEYDSDSKFFCFPSQISWDHYENLQQIIPNINKKHYLKVKNSRSEKIDEPKTYIVTEGEPSKLCHACSKSLNEEKTDVKSSSDPCANKCDSRNTCSKHLVTNSSQYKDVSNLGQLCNIKNDLVPGNDMGSCNTTNLTLNEIGKPVYCSLPNNDTNQVCQNHNVERSDVNSNSVEKNDLKERNETIKCEKKQSKMLHSHTVKKIFSHAKEYLNFRKYSTSSIRSDHGNGILQGGGLNSTNHYAGKVSKIEDHPCVNSKRSVGASDIKWNSDYCDVNKKQCSTPKASCLENDSNITKLADVQGRLSNKEMFRSNTALLHDYTDTKISKSSTYKHSQTNLKDEKYRLYGSNIISLDDSSTEDNNSKYIKNEFKILESESECEGFSEEMYCYSSSEWQSEVAKNWVAKTQKKQINYDNRVKDSLKKNKSKSFYFLRSTFSNCKVEKEEKCESNNNKPMINATIALSPDTKKGKKKLGVRDQFQISPYSKQKSDHRFSNLFSSSIKNNYKKIKGMVKSNHTHQKQSTSRVAILKLPSCNETQSQSFLTPVTSTCITTNSGDSTLAAENSTMETLCDESKINNYTSDSNFAKSDPVIRKIEPGIWEKFVSRKLSKQSTELTETQNIETGNSSMSDISIEESSLQRSNHRLIKPFHGTHSLKHTQKHSKNYFLESRLSVLSIKGPNSHQVNGPVLSISMDEYNQSNESLLNCSFQNPMVDPKTGFRPLLPS